MKKTTIILIFMINITLLTLGNVVHAEHNFDLIAPKCVPINDYAKYFVFNRSLRSRKEGKIDRVSSAFLYHGKQVRLRNSKSKDDINTIVFPYDECANGCEGHFYKINSNISKFDFYYNSRIVIEFTYPNVDNLNSNPVLVLVNKNMDLIMKIINLRAVGDIYEYDSIEVKNISEFSEHNALVDVSFYKQCQNASNYLKAAE